MKKADIEETGVMQIQADTVYYRSEPGEPQTELELRGNRLCLFTKDDKIFRRFKAWKQMVLLVPYYRGYFTGHRQLVAADLYFPKSARKQLLKALNDEKEGAEVKNDKWYCPTPNHCSDCRYRLECPQSSAPEKVGVS